MLITWDKCCPTFFWWWHILKPDGSLCLKFVYWHKFLVILVPKLKIWLQNSLNMCYLSTDNVCKLLLVLVHLTCLISIHHQVSSKRQWVGIYMMGNVYRTTILHEFCRFWVKVKSNSQCHSVNYKPTQYCSKWMRLK